MKTIGGQIPSQPVVDWLWDLKEPIPRLSMLDYNELLVGSALRSMLLHELEATVQDHSKSTGLQQALPH